MSHPVERTSKIVTSVDTLPQAWQFVMAHIESVGPRPSVHISPVTHIAMNGDDYTELFEVAVSGMVTDGTDEGDER